jgi:protocatechuate 3,4-dioxygenase beta subunit
MIDMPTRRVVLAAGVLAADSTMRIDGSFAAAALPATPVCHEADEVTLRQTEGPYFKPSSPERADLLEAGTSGRQLELSGYVLSRACKPLAGALLDFWHADKTGEYDNSGFRLRGHQFSDAQGRYRLHSIVPGLYAGRTRHIHVKVQPRGGRVLTTQLYFPGEPGNHSDSLFRSELLMRTAETAGLLAARFDFVLGSG